MLWRRNLSLQARETLDAYIGLLPFLLGFVIFIVGPLVYSFYLSFTRYEILSPPRWSGLENYARMFTKDEVLWQSLRVTLIFTLVAVPTQVVVGYAMALILNLKVRGLSFWRTAFYMPAVVPAMAVAYVFSWMLQSDVGLVNQFLRSIGLPGPKWFGDPNWVLAAFILMSAWAVGGTLLLYLSALQGVPTELYDAAKVDGANAWRRFLNVTLPMTSPIIFFVFLTGMIGTFQVFTVAFVTTNGGPGNASLFYILYLYRTGWEYLQMGYAAAMAWLLFVILVALTLLSLRLSQSTVFYEGAQE
jgi:multiple sugar transport system permease protein